MKENEQTGAGDQPRPNQRARAGNFRENQQAEQRRPKQRRVAEGRDYVGRRRGKGADQTKVADDANEAQEEHQAGVGKPGRDGGKRQKSAAEQDSGKRRVKQGRHRQIGAMQKPSRDLIERIGESGEERKQHGKRKIHARSANDHPNAHQAGKNACPYAWAHFFTENEDRERGDENGASPTQWRKSRQVA